MIFHVNYAAASEPLDPDPIGTPLEGGYWNFSEGDIYAWTHEFYEDGILMNPNEPPGILNVSEITYEDASSYFDYAISEYFYAVKVKRMFWNGTSNSLQEFSDPEVAYGVAINFTNSEIYSSFVTNLNFPVPVFIPKNSSNILALHWFAEAYNRTIMELAPFSFNTKINVDIDERMFSIVDDDVDFDFNSVFKYDSNGVIESLVAFAEFIGYFSVKEVFNRTENVNPIDEIEWPVKKGEVIYVGFDADEIKIDIVDIVNYTEESGWTTQIVAVNVSIWNDALEEWQILNVTEDINDRDKIIFIGEANEYFIPNPRIGLLVYPIGTTGEDLAKIYTDILLWSDECNFDKVEYGDYWVYIEDTSTGKYNKYTLFPNSIINCYYEEFDVYFYDHYDEIGIQGGDEFIWEVTKVDEDALQNVLGEEWAGYLQYNFSFGVGANEFGAKQKISIYDVYSDTLEDYEGWNIDGETWSWTTEAFEENPDLDDVEQFLFMNPEELENPPMWFCPKYDEDDDELYSVEEYLNNIGYSLSWYNEETKVWINMSAEMGFNINMTKIYDEITGAILSIQLVNESSEIIYEIQLTSYTYYPPGEDGYPYLMYYENLTSLTSGLNQINASASGIGMICNITVYVNASTQTEVMFSSFTDNPSDVPINNAILYFNLFISNSSEIIYPMNITIEIPETLATSGKILKIYYFNETTEVWQEVNYTLVGNKILITIYHASIFSIIATIPLIPSNGDDGKGKKTKGEAIPGYDIFTLIGIISLITVILIRSLRKSKKFEN